ncbi:hypothetical protein BDY21DRAFT_126841 [Lineolata rhizophorae]|uniref:Uncharacterized protein n=1 Tax=Lineolata rhizophorae TaxID=578093 RepID=A0A6A6NP38_9PEZI|nr:hypothetical protein BDY21DRAFT_126841 [Lineolata rhizophorae]
MWWVTRRPLLLAPSHAPFQKNPQRRAGPRKESHDRGSASGPVVARAARGSIHTYILRTHDPGRRSVQPSIARCAALRPLHTYAPLLHRGKGRRISKKKKKYPGRIPRIDLSETRGASSPSSSLPWGPSIHTLAVALSFSARHARWVQRRIWSKRLAEEGEGAAREGGVVSSLRTGGPTRGRRRILNFSFVFSPPPALSFSFFFFFAVPTWREDSRASYRVPGRSGRVVGWWVGARTSCRLWGGGAARPREWASAISSHAGMAAAGGVLER